MAGTDDEGSNGPGVSGGSNGILTYGPYGGPFTTTVLPEPPSLVLGAIAVAIAMGFRWAARSRNRFLTIAARTGSARGVIRPRGVRNASSRTAPRQGESGLDHRSVDGSGGLGDEAAQLTR